MADVRSTTPNLGLIKYSRGHPVTDVDLATNADLIDAGVPRIAKAIYDFDVDAGAISTITPVTTAVIPDNAVIIGGTINATTAATSAGSATISVGTSAGSSSASIISLTAVASYSADAVLISDTAATPVKTTAAGSITVSIAVADLTAGVIEVTVLYYVANA